MTTEDTVNAILILTVIAGVYFLPALIAACRGHRNVVAITALNLLIGWTFLGWLAAFIWSLTETRRHAAPRYVNCADARSRWPDEFAR